MAHFTFQCVSGSRSDCTRPRVVHSLGGAVGVHACDAVQHGTVEYCGLYVCLFASISPELYYLTGGYVPDRELFVRWTALTAFMPAMQFSLTPWNYDDETVAIVRKFAELHATTIGDEIEAVAKEAVEHGSTTVFLHWAGFSWREACRDPPIIVGH